ncbi:hypothetical protein [Hyphomicrobium sp.]|uniref:hypothetical protein n=1 Tax=Hyphomicrobium sp. TaxID=82 RepID=UPI000FB1B604|nr:hypothetical protein [Hyphomicrobium sp.]RUP09258.1 MAG: hypothetical protein EKK38_11615 [Hyphomicrobium sp.]
MAKRFSKIFKLGLDQPQLDFVDITPATDTRLFIDPFAISLKSDEWSIRCHVLIKHFFSTALASIKAGREKEAKDLLNGLSEPNETCLGHSKGTPAGRGVSGKQAFDLYESLSKSQAAKTGLLEELADCDLFVEGIGPDKLSDITTNIIRRPLIEYTQDQCKLHGIALLGSYPSGRYWDIEERCWRSDYHALPVVGKKPVILVPKYSVRRKMCLDAQEYYSHHVINYIQQEEFERGTSLVRTLRSGEKRPPYKKAVKEKFPFTKDFLARFSEANPEVLEHYKKFYRKLMGRDGELSHEDFEDQFLEEAFAEAMKERFKEIFPGDAHAGKFHSFIVGVLEYVFWPHLIYPKKEDPIHDGRKRIDITYTNAARDGFFYRVHTAHNIGANYVMVECKNYSKDPANPEIDQMSGRFSTNRGRLGLLVYRDVNEYDRLLKRCRDTAQDGRGVIIPIGDDQLIEFLDLISQGKRHVIDDRLEKILEKLLK